MRMKKENLNTGDIIVNRAGYLGVVLMDEDYILYQEIGMDLLEEFNDDLIYNDDDYREGDIMQVYRGCTFINLEDNKPWWERDKHWVRPDAKERKARETLMEKKRQEKVEEMRKIESESQKQNDRIHIISQYFYGNRTGTEISRNLISHFLRGCLDESCGMEAVQDAAIQMIQVPHADNIVIVYDQTQEERYVHVEFPEIYARESADYLKDWGAEMKMHVSCEIPEIGVKIHTRCFACRIDENGILQSLENGDYRKFIHYFPIR